jgi:hypothetical protein
MSMSISKSDPQDLLFCIGEIGSAVAFGAWRISLLISVQLYDIFHTGGSQ